MRACVRASLLTKGISATYHRIGEGVNTRSVFPAIRRDSLLRILDEYAATLGKVR